MDLDWLGNSESFQETKEEVFEGGSWGDLPKRVQFRESEKFYLKGRMSSLTLEPEVEVACTQLAKIMGIPHVEYWLEEHTELGTVSVSKDFTEGNPRVSLFRFLGSEISKKRGRQKYNLVVDSLSPECRLQHDLILFFDFIVGNRDRHLRNFDMVKEDGQWKLAPMYDNGMALFSRESNKHILNQGLAFNYNDDFSRPYKETHTQQIKLVDLKRLVWNLPTEYQIKCILESSFEAERAVLLLSFIKRNFKEVGHEV